MDETALTLLQGVLFVKGTWARVGASYADLDRSVALANGRVRCLPWDLTLRGYPETFAHRGSEITQHPGGNETQDDRRDRAC